MKRSKRVAAVSKMLCLTRHSICWAPQQEIYPLPLRNMPLACFRQRKTSPNLVRFLIMFALPIFTASHPATIVGVHVLNFCVRDGNRWTHMTINTNYVDGIDPSFMSKAIRLLTLKHCNTQMLLCQHLFSKMLVHLQGLEPGTH